MSHPTPAMQALLEVMARLRDPQSGCPWDLVQDFASIAPYTVEEAHEVADVIQNGPDPAALQDELGDLLLQTVYHAQMSQERGWFDFEAVAAGVTAKMIRRHPHVFGSAEIATAEAQTEAWEVQKSNERARRAEVGVLAGVAQALPGLTRAVKLSKRAASVGFVWPTVQDVVAKLHEEVGELLVEVEAGDMAKARDELGDVLFVAANLARTLDIDPEDAVRSTNAKFVRRFQYVEARLAERGRTPDQSDLAEMDGLWNAAKAIDKAKG
jgi:MazG family protein